MANTRYLRSIAVIFDSLIALVLVAGAAIWADYQHIPRGGLAGFLAMRITLLNACFAAVFAVIWVKCWEMLGLDRRDYTALPRTVVRTLAGAAWMTCLLVLFEQSRHTGDPVRRIALGFFLAAFVYELCRVLLRNRGLRGKGGEPERVLILGTGRRASRAFRELRTRYHRSKHLLGFFDDRDPASMPPDIAGRFLGSIEQLPEYLLRNVVDELIVATPMRSCYDLTQRAISIAEAAGVSVICLNDVFDLNHGANLRHNSRLFFGLVPKDEAKEFAETLKRILDVCGAALGLVLLSPLFLVVGIAVKLTSPGPVFFKQKRYGYARRQFWMYKFRSMVQDAPAQMAFLETQNEAQGPIFKMRNDPRVTTLGRFLRSTSLDELPQLWNVLIGDMSLVGPRPMSVRDVSLFSEAQIMRRFSVRPGITGSWQVSGRTSLNFEQWIALDFRYIDEWSLGLDLQILARTLPVVLKRHGV